MINFFSFLVHFYFFADEKEKEEEMRLNVVRGLGPGSRGGSDGSRFQGGARWVQVPGGGDDSKLYDDSWVFLVSQCF